MAFVVLLVDCLLAPWTLLIVLAIGTFPNQMRSQSANFNALTALAANDEHRAGIEVMHVLVVLLYEPFVDSLTKFTHFFLIYKFCRSLFGNINKLIPHLQLHLSLLPSRSSLLRSFWLYGFLVKILRLVRMT